MKENQLGDWEIELFQFPSNGKVDFRKKMVEIKADRIHFASFNSLQTGKWISESIGDSVKLNGRRVEVSIPFKRESGFPKVSQIK